MNDEQLKRYPYEARLEENDGLTYFVVRFIDFDHVGGAGDTIDEAIALAYEALGTMVDNMEEEGIPIPPPTVTPLQYDVSGRVTLRMPKSLHRKLIRRADEEGVSINTVIVTALAEFLASSPSLRESKKQGAANPIPVV